MTLQITNKSNENPCLFLVKTDDDSEININDDVLNKMFNDLCTDSELIYFLGRRLNFYENERVSIIKKISTNLLIDELNNEYIFFELNSTFVLNRYEISKLWSHYEFAALLFLKKNSTIDLMEYIKNQFNGKLKIEYPRDICMLYKKFSENAFWIEKGKDYNFKIPVF
jgi:hypothetical protein